MTPIRQAIELYARLGQDFAEVHGRYAEQGFVYNSPTQFIMARPIARKLPGVWLKPGAPAADCWFVELAIGPDALAKCVSLIPYPLPWLGWIRGAKDTTMRRRFYRTDRVTNLIHRLT